MCAVVQNSVSTVDGFNQATFVGLDPFDVLHVVWCHHVVVVAAGWEFLAVHVSQLWVVAGWQMFVPWEFLDVTQTVRQTLHVVAFQQLPVSEQVQFTATIVPGLVVGSVHPEWIVLVQVVVPRVHANIFGEVSQFLFVVQHQFAVGVVGQQCEVEFAIDHFHVFESLHLGALCLTDGLGVEEELWLNFVWCWHLETGKTFVVDDHAGQNVDKHFGADVITQPNHGLVESFPVLGGVQQVVDHMSLLPVHPVGDVEHFVDSQKSMLVFLPEHFDSFWFVEMLQVLHEIPILGDFVMFVVQVLLVHVQKQFVDDLLLHHEFLIGNLWDAGEVASANKSARSEEYKHSNRLHLDRWVMTDDKLQSANGFYTQIFWSSRETAPFAVVQNFLFIRNTHRLSAISFSVQPKMPGHLCRPASCCVRGCCCCCFHMQKCCCCPLLLHNATRQQCWARFMIRNDRIILYSLNLIFFVIDKGT